jgi:hypothetical protein
MLQTRLKSFHRSKVRLFVCWFVCCLLNFFVCVTVFDDFFIRPILPLYLSLSVCLSVCLSFFLFFLFFLALLLSFFFALPFPALILCLAGGKTLIKRDLTVIDDSNVEIRLTLWGEKAANNDHPWKTEPIVAFKGVTVGDYGGKSLSALGSTVMTFNPDIPEGHALHAWRSSLGGTLPVAQSLSAGGGMFP